MHTFRTLARQIGTVPSPVAVALGGIDRAQGRRGALSGHGRETLSTLREIARIQSVESSNAIENITAPSERIRELVSKRARPENRPEEEIAGYRAVLDTINADAAHIPFKPSVVEQLHRDLYQFTNMPAGRWKKVENSIQETRPDGVKAVRFRTVSAVETPAAMEELHERFAAARESGEHHPLLLVGCYVFDFLAIHPFSDGNGRMSRLLTLLALYQADYEIGRFVSLERLIDQTRDTYYDALQAAGHGWHEDEHDIEPWLRYFLGILTAASKELEAGAAQFSGRGAKREAIARFIRGSTAEEFTVADVRRAVPAASDSYIDKTLAKLRDEGLIESLGTGRNARWRRLAGYDSTA
ncbi:MAG TPA: Fic family protein [Solirubrobacteraceae bacterium]|nr:Fic family protein [Solirubrobacteraceae bacterium]